MTGEEMERAISFLLEHQAHMDAAIGEMREAIGEMRGAIAEMRIQADADRKQMRNAVTELSVQADADRREIRDAIGKLVDVVENTRDFAQQIAQLTIATGKRVNGLETRVERLEQS